MRLSPIAVLCVIGLGWVNAGESAPVDAAKAPDAETLARLVKQLGSDDFDARNQAQEALLKLDKGSVQPLRKALADATDEETRVRLRRVIDALAIPLALSIEQIGEARVGQKVEFKLLIKNVGEEDVNVLPCLDGSSSCRRFPHFQRVIDPDPKLEGLIYCKFMNALAAADFKLLKPGESFEVCGPKSFGSEITEWTPVAAGKFVLTYTCDYSEPLMAKWMGNPGGDPEVPVKEKWRTVPKVKVSAKIEVEVKP